MHPNHLLNLTHKFSQILKKNMDLVASYVETPASATPEEQKAYFIEHIATKPSMSVDAPVF